MRRIRTPVIFSLRRARRPPKAAAPSSWNHPGRPNPHRPAQHRPSYRPAPPRTNPTRAKGPARRLEIHWPSVAAYGSVLAVAGWILWNHAPAPGIDTGSVPVSSAVFPRHSWLGSLVDSFKVGPQAAANWLAQAIPGVSPPGIGIDWHGLLAAGVSDVAGRSVQSLQDLLWLGLPGFSEAAAAPTRPPVRKPLPLPKALQAVDPTLPGDNGKVWAELGQNPLVGIYHTHSRDSFWSEVPKGSSAPYSTVWDKTVIQVGWWLATDLNQFGVSVVQSRVDNMSQGLLASYTNSLQTIKTLVKWYPTVRILLDVDTGPGNAAQTTATIDGVKTAKISVVVGTNKVLPDPTWQQNLSFAVKLAAALKGISPNLVQGTGVDIVPYRYNEQVMPGDLLVQIGGAYNTLAEERAAANDLAQALVQVIHAKAYPEPSAPPSPAPTSSSQH